MGRIELHAALQALERAYIAVRDHEEQERAIPEYVADENIAPISKSTPRPGPRSAATTPSLLPPVLPVNSKAALGLDITGAVRSTFAPWIDSSTRILFCKCVWHAKLTASEGTAPYLAASCAWRCCRGWARTWWLCRPG